MHRINKQKYKELMAMGWTLSQIDESDFFFALDLLYEREEKTEAIQFADQVPWL